MLLAVTMWKRRDQELLHRGLKEEQRDTEQCPVVHEEAPWKEMKKDMLRSW